jgi:hypothetical protein
MLERKMSKAGDDLMSLMAKNNNGSIPEADIKDGYSNSGLDDAE